MRVPDSDGSGGGPRVLTPEDFTPHARMLPKRQGSQGGTLEFLAMLLLPTLVFSFIVALFVLAFQAFQLLVWMLVGACALLALLFVHVGSRGRPLQLALGLLIVAAVAIAVPIGRFVEKNYMAEFWRLDSGAVYRRLNPLDPGSSHTDAAMVTFQEGAFVDVPRSLGYMKGGVVYCVAPITSAGANQSQVPEYWAAGENCCAQRGSFSCGDVDIAGARSGLAVYDGDGNYRTAVRMAQSAYEMRPPPGGVVPTGGASPPVLLRWTADNDSYMDSLLKGAVMFGSIASGVFLLGSGCAAAVLAPRLAR